MILPPPGEGFEWRETAFGPALVCGALERIAPHFFTTRQWVLGRTPAGQHAGWEDVAAGFGTGSRSLARLRQVHGREVVRADSAASASVLPEGDIVIADDSGVAVAVQAADCVPILVADSRQGVVAAAHAGWRGLAAGVPGVTVEALRQNFGSNPVDLIVAVGPAISSCCYEVGNEVRRAFVGGGFAAGDLERWFHETPTPDAINRSMTGLPLTPRSDHWYFDGRVAAIDQLRGRGVPDSRIFSARLCTASHPELFPSFRRDGAAAGRLAAAIAGQGRGAAR